MGVGAAVVLLIVGIAVAILAGLASPAGGVRPVSAPTPSGAPAITPATTSSDAALVVHVLGQVERPGVYELPGGARVLDAIAAAGGFTAAADHAALNLARQVGDGEQLVVTKPGEAPPPADTAPDAVGGGSGGAGAARDQKLDLNSATADQLQALPRIGPALAQRIVDWRSQNGRFATVDDLRNVAGIGDKTFADLKDLVMVR